MPPGPEHQQAGEPPHPGKDFEFRFYFDVEASVKSKDTQTILSQLEKEDFFTFLGAYSEVF